MPEIKESVTNATRRKSPETQGCMCGRPALIGVPVLSLDTGPAGEPLSIRKAC
jgi:hypothetical protein